MWWLILGGVAVRRHGGEEWAGEDVQVLVEFEDDENAHERLDDHHKHGEKERIHRHQVAHLRRHCGGSDPIEHKSARVRHHREDGEIGDGERGAAKGRYVPLLARRNKSTHIGSTRCIGSTRMCATHEHLFGQEAAKGDYEQRAQAHLDAECEQVAQQERGVDEHSGVSLAVGDEQRLFSAGVAREHVDDLLVAHRLTIE